jgi:hypothetical protein
MIAGFWEGRVRPNDTQSVLHLLVADEASVVEHFFTPDVEHMTIDREIGRR